MHWYMLPLQKEVGAIFEQDMWRRGWRGGGKAIRVCHFFGKGTGWGAVNWCK